MTAVAGRCIEATRRARATPGPGRGDHSRSARSAAAAEDPTGDPRLPTAAIWLLLERRTHRRFAALAGNGGSRAPVPSTPAGSRVADVVQQFRASIADAAEKLLRAPPRCSTRNHLVVTRPILSFLMTSREGSDKEPYQA